MIVYACVTTSQAQLDRFVKKKKISSKKRAFCHSRFVRNSRVMWRGNPSNSHSHDLLFARVAVFQPSQRTRVTESVNSRTRWRKHVGEWRIIELLWIANREQLVCNLTMSFSRARIARSVRFRSRRRSIAARMACVSRRGNPWRSENP